MKLISVEPRVYPTLGLELAAGETIELADDPGIPGLIPVDPKRKTKETGDIVDGSGPTDADSPGEGA